MAIPNREAIVDQVAETHGDLLVTNTAASCTEFLQWCLAAMPAGEPWGLLSKAPGEGGHTFDNGVRVSYDVLAWRDPFTQVDVLIAASANDSPNPADHGKVATPTWSEIDPHEYRPHNVWVDPASVPSPAPPLSPAHHCALGCSWFWLMAGVKFWPDTVKANLDWLASNLQPTYLRALVCVGGDEFPDGSGNYSDPWQHCGSWLSWPDHGQLLERVTDVVHDHGMQMEWTLIGGLAQIPSDIEQDALADHFVRHMAGREHKLQLVEVMNEYAVNGGTTSLLRRLARRVRRGLPDVPLSLSSPNSVMGSATENEINAEVEAMYGGLPEADAITPHWNRGHHVAPNMGPHCPPLCYSNEPRGPGASAGGDVSNPQVLASDYQKAIDAGYVGYVFHCDWGVWNSHLHAAFVTPSRGSTANVWQTENMAAIASALCALSTGAAPPPGIGTGPDPGPEQPPAVAAPRSALHANDILEPGAALVNGPYSVQNQPDGNLVSYGPTGPYWTSATDTQDGVAGNLQMQTDGNLVLSRQDGAPVWATDTAGHDGAMAQLQPDGNLVVYAAGVPVWASGPAPAAEP